MRSADLCTTDIIRTKRIQHYLVMTPTVSGVQNVVIEDLSGKRL